jgi:hypothetical protein
MRKLTFFFLTSADLRNWLAEVEQYTPVSYAQVGSYDSEHVPISGTAGDISWLGSPLRGDCTREEKLLLLPKLHNFVTRSLSVPSGGARYLLYPDTNPASVVLTPGGLFQNKAIIIGELSTTSKDRTSIDLYSLMLQRLQSQGTTVQGIVVGQEALSKARAGIRLCERVSAPIDQDLIIR